ncbi:MAG: hypothetical protein FVQ83_01900 [Chloroflexi bacterium]|nr:hypothetical protein [Chloroflexota bacterium]
MSRIINPDSVGKQRKLLTRAVVLSLRELLIQPEPNEQTRDIASFIVLTLKEISANVDRTVTPWEKRNYWLKADRFRMDWDWTITLGDKMRQAVLDEDWSVIAACAANMGEKLANVKLPKKHGLGTPWIGANERLQETLNNNE